MTTARTLVVWVPCRLVSPNVREHWATRAKRVKAQRKAAMVSVLGLMHAVRFERADRSKRILMTAHVARKMDTDNLAASLKAIRDGLQDCGLIHDDGPESGHSFVYHQRVAKPTGVEIEVRLA